MDQSDEVSLDVNELANSLREQLKINKAFSRACCIYRVPERLRKLNEKAYTPRAVSIGPLHHGKENLKAMEGHKIMYLQQFLEQNSSVSVEDLISIIKENETKLRDCYAETIDLRRKDFATMILLDAVFIIMFLLNMKYFRGFYESRRSDHIFYRPFKLVDVMFDMSLLENQLPFFILQKLFEQSSGAANHVYGDTFVNDYSTFISCLVRAAKDVEVLAQNENLKNMLSNDEAISNLFHNLIIENVISSQSFLSGSAES